MSLLSPQSVACTYTESVCVYMACHIPCSLAPPFALLHHGKTLNWGRDIKVRMTNQTILPFVLYRYPGHQLTHTEHWPATSCGKRLDLVLKLMFPQLQLKFVELSHKRPLVQRCRLPHTRTSVACWNYIWCVRLTGSRAQLVCSYFTKAQQSGPDFTHRNQTPVNTYSQLLSSFVPFHVRVKVSGLTFVIGNFRMSLLLFGFSSNQPPAKKAMRRKKESKSGTRKRESKQKMARLLEVSSQRWKAFVAH